MVFLGHKSKASLNCWTAASHDTLCLYRRSGFVLHTYIWPDLQVQRRQPWIFSSKQLPANQ